MKGNDFQKVSEFFRKQMKSCTLCPINCKINRYRMHGRCKVGILPRVSNALLHFGEEPPISGKGGAGTVFFSGCNLRCIYCQNMFFSQKAHGVELTPEDLAEIFLEFQAEGAETLNLVTPTPHLPGIVEALHIANSKGFSLPVVYNTSGYESTQALKMMNGVVDIYLADLKYSSDDTGKAYSGVQDYFSVAKKAIIEMYHQVGAFKESNGKGLIIRHLLLPEGVNEAKEVLEFVAFGLSPSVPVSLMSQYIPVFKATVDTTLSRKVHPEEYNQVIQYAIKLGLHGWMQSPQMQKVTARPIPWSHKLSRLYSEKQKK